MVNARETVSVDEALDLCWNEQLANVPRRHQTWFHARRQELLLVAQGTPLRKLFPYTSHNSPAFQQVLDVSIHARLPMDLVRAGAAVRHLRARAVRTPRKSWDPPPPILLDTADVDQAIATARGRATRSCSHHLGRQRRS